MVFCETTHTVIKGKYTPYQISQYKSIVENPSAGGAIKERTLEYLVFYGLKVTDFPRKDFARSLNIF